MLLHKDPITNRLKRQPYSIGVASLLDDLVFEVDLHDVLSRFHGGAGGSAWTAADVLLGCGFAKDTIDTRDFLHGTECVQVLLVVATNQVVVPLDIDKNVEDVGSRCLGVEHRSIVAEPCESLFGCGRVDILQATIKPSMNQRRTGTTRSVGLCVEPIPHTRT